MSLHTSGPNASNQHAFSSEAVFGKLLRHRGWLVSGGLVVVLSLSSFLTYNSHWWIGSASSPVRLTVSGGCPSSLADHNGVSNGGFGLWFEMVPRNPAGALVCSYVPPLSPPLVYRKLLTGPEAQVLASAANASSTDRHLFTGLHCAFGGGNITVIAFSYHGRPDVDLWYDEAGCPTLTNGRLQSSPAVQFENVA